MLEMRALQMLLLTRILAIRKLPFCRSLIPEQRPLGTFSCLLMRGQAPCTRFNESAKTLSDEKIYVGRVVGHFCVPLRARAAF